MSLIEAMARGRNKRLGVRALIGDRRGVAAVEFALMLPILLLLFVGCSELMIMVLAMQRVEKLAASVADIVTQSEVASKSGMDTVLGAAKEIMKPIDFGDNGIIIVTSVYRAPGAIGPTINWQYKGGGLLNEASAIGTPGGNPALPANFVVDERENVLIAEVFYTYKPIFIGLIFDETIFYRRAFFRPRLGALTAAPV